MTPPEPDFRRLWGPDHDYVYVERLGIADDLGLPTDLGSPAELHARYEAEVAAKWRAAWPAARIKAVGGA